MGERGGYGGIGVGGGAVDGGGKKGRVRGDGSGM